MMMDLSRNWRPTLKQFLGDSPWNLTASLFSIGFCFQHVVFNMPSKVVSMKNLGEHIIAAFPPEDGRLAEAG